MRLARAIRRANRAAAIRAPARAGAGAQDTRESGSRRSGKPGGGKNGTEWNETG